MKWLGTIIVAVALLIVLGAPTPVLADTSANVTVTAAGFICGTPSGLTLTYISDYEVGISWTKGEDTVNTMVRAKYGSYPTSITNGYLVYSGNGTSTSDTGVNFDETFSEVHYRAWGQNALGVFGDFVEGKIGGRSVLLIAFIVLAMGLTIPIFALKSGRAILAFAGAGAWVILGVHSYTCSIMTWDIHYALFWLAMGMVIVCALLPAVMRSKKEDIREDIYVDDIDRQEKEWNDYQRQVRIPRLGRYRRGKSK